MTNRIHYALDPQRMEAATAKTDQLEAACRANGLITLSRTLVGSHCRDCDEAIRAMTVGERHRRQEWERLSGWGG
jgi:hypothetical protein